MVHEFMRGDEASRYLKDRWKVSYSPQTLAKLRSIGGGAKFRKISRFPVYTSEDLDEWARSRMSGLVGSTSELGI